MVGVGVLLGQPNEVHCVLCGARYPRTPRAGTLTREELELQKWQKVIDPHYHENREKAERVATQTHRECPDCKEDMRRDASVCPHCRRESQAWTQNEGFWWKPADDGTWLYLDEASGKWRAPDANRLN